MSEPTKCGTGCITPSVCHAFFCNKQVGGGVQPSMFPATLVCSHVGCDCVAATPLPAPDPKDDGGMTGRYLIVNCATGNVVADDDDRDEAFAICEANNEENSSHKYIVADTRLAPHGEAVLGYDESIGQTYAVAFTPPGDNRSGAPPTLAELLASIAELEVRSDGYSYAAFGPKTRAVIADALTHPVPAARVTSEMIAEWQERHGLQMSPTDAFAAVSDARSLAPSEPTR